MKLRIFSISAVVYILLNLIENTIHYNIGKFTESTFQYTLPTLSDEARMIGVMLTFAFLQGFIVAHWVVRKP
jgi:hypothetical protein